MARDAGAKKVYFASAAPMVKYPNVYGIDMPAKAELIASHRSVEEIQDIIGADRLIFQDLDDLKAAVRTSKVPVIQDFDCSVFDGVYVTGDIDEQYLTDLEQSRSDTAKKEKDGYIDVNIDAASVDLSGIKEEM
jgi:amidophosphoribosyltransferase